MATEIPNVNKYMYQHTKHYHNNVNCQSIIDLLYCRNYCCHILLMFTENEPLKVNLIAHIAARPRRPSSLSACPAPQQERTGSYFRSASPHWLSASNPPLRDPSLLLFLRFSRKGLYPRSSPRLFAELSDLQILSKSPFCFCTSDPVI